MLKRSVGITGFLVMIMTSLLGCTRSRVSMSDFRGGVVNPAVPKPALTLIDQLGETYDFRKETDGHATLLFFGYTNCPDVCPLQMARIAAALRDLDPSVVKQLRVVFVSVDPERDTPERLAQWLGAFHESFIGLRGESGQVDAALLEMRFQTGRVERLEDGSYGVAHASAVIGYTPDNVGRLLYFSGTTAEDFAHDIPLLVRFRDGG